MKRDGDGWGWTGMKRDKEGWTWVNRDRHWDKPLTPAAGSPLPSLEVALYLVSFNFRKPTPGRSDGRPGESQLQARPWLCKNIFPTPLDKSTNTPAPLIRKKSVVYSAGDATI